MEVIASASQDLVNTLQEPVGSRGTTSSLGQVAGPFVASYDGASSQGDTVMDTSIETIVGREAEEEIGPAICQAWMTQFNGAVGGESRV